MTSEEKAEYNSLAEICNDGSNFEIQAVSPRLHRSQPTLSSSKLCRHQSHLIPLANVHCLLVMGVQHLWHRQLSKA